MDERTIQFKMHGPDREDVSAAVFADKLTTLVRALKAADEAANGRVGFDYRIVKLHTSAPTAILRQAELPKVPSPIIESPFDAFDRCVASTLIGDREGALRYGRCSVNIEKLAKGAPRKFSYAELAISGQENIIRVDHFLSEQARAVIAPMRVPEMVEDQRWYKGSVHGSFDGRIEAVDLRGALPEITLILSAGGKEIDCVCREGDVEKIREALHRRVRLTGTAIYDGKSGLPRRLQVSDIEHVEGASFTEWKGAFRPFEIPDWDGDDA